MLETIGPVWDGNEVWLVVAGGATFAAFPAWYATMFSGFYLALLLVLVLLIVRVVSFEWREQEREPALAGDWLGERVGSIGAPFIWGVAPREPRCTASRSTPTATSPATSGTSSAPTPSSPGSRWCCSSRFHGATFLTLRTSGDLLRAGRRGRASARAARRRSSSARFLVWTVVVAVDRNDKDVFPPVGPGRARDRRARPRRAARRSGGAAAGRSR